MNAQKGRSLKPSADQVEVSKRKFEGGYCDLHCMFSMQSQSMPIKFPTVSVTVNSTVQMHAQYPCFYTHADSDRGKTTRRQPGEDKDIELLFVERGIHQFRLGTALLVGLFESGGAACSTAGDRGKGEGMRVFPWSWGHLFGMCPCVQQSPSHPGNAC